MRSVLQLVLLCFILLFSGCGPKVTIRSLKPAEVDMAAMRRLLVLDFDYHLGGVASIEDFFLGILARSVGLDYGDSYQSREAASHADDVLLAALAKNGYFIVLDGGELRTFAKAREKAWSMGAEAIFTGNIDRAHCERTTFIKSEKIHDKKLNKTVTKEIPWVRQKCDMTLSYRIVRTTDNMSVVKKRFHETHEQEVEEQYLSNLLSPPDYYEGVVDKIIPRIIKQIAPHEVIETRRLKKNAGHDPDFDRAMGLVKEGRLKAARTLFHQCWQATLNPTAGFNAAILAESEGDLQAAVNLLGEIIKVNSDASILKEHRRMIKALGSRIQAEEQLRERKNTN